MPRGAYLPLCGTGRVTALTLHEFVTLPSLQRKNRTLRCLRLLTTEGWNMDLINGIVAATILLLVATMVSFVRE